MIVFSTVIAGNGGMTLSVPKTKTERNGSSLRSGLSVPLNQVWNVTVTPPLARTEIF